MNAIKMLRTLNMDISSDILCTLTFGIVKLYCFFEHHSNYLWWLLRGFNFPLFATNRLIMNFYDRFALSKVFH